MKAIDFVILWVDDSDEKWQKKKAEYSNGDYNTQAVRFRDWGFLPYWFRAVEKYAPWVRKIHFVTEGHVPKWLDTENPRLHIVKHSDFMPGDTLPTFNSSAIEIYINRIPGLAEHFVFFNDDMFLNNEVEPCDFFVHGLPRDMLALQPVVANPDNPTMTHIFTNNSLCLSRHFSKRKNMKAQSRAYFKIGYPIKNFAYNLIEAAYPRFTGFYTQHGASPFLKSAIQEVWEEEREALDRTGHNRFRSDTDVNQYLFREWQKLTGRFVPANIERDFVYTETGRDDRRIVQYIISGSKKIICINDSGKGDFENSKKTIIKAFQKSLPTPSSFEKAE